MVLISIEKRSLLIKDQVHPRIKMEEETNVFVGKEEFPKVSLDNLKNQGSSLHKVT